MKNIAWFLGAAGIIYLGFSCRVRVQENASLASSKSSGCTSEDVEFANAQVKLLDGMFSGGQVGRLKAAEFLLLLTKSCSGAVSLMEFCEQIEANFAARKGFIAAQARLGAKSEPALSSDLLRDVVVAREKCANFK